MCALEQLEVIDEDEAEHAPETRPELYARATVDEFPVATLGPEHGGYAGSGVCKGGHRQHCGGCLYVNEDGGGHNAIYIGQSIIS